jgi:hypothetical protein
MPVLVWWFRMSDEQVTTAPDPLKRIVVTINKDTGDTDTTIEPGFSPVEIWGISRMLEQHATNIWLEEQMRQQIAAQQEAAKQRGGIIPVASIPQDHRKRRVS